MDDRRLTLIVVPHGDLETRSFEIPYRFVKLALVAAAVLVLGFAFVLASLFPVWAQAARVPSLERQLKQLENERAKVTELAKTLAEVEAQYERVRALLGADAVPQGENPLLPPLHADSPAAAGVKPPESGRDSQPQADASPVSAWPLSFAGFITQAQTRGRASHPGVDIAVPLNSHILAAGSGVVEEAGSDEIYGLYALIDHGNGIESLYGHASKLFVERGDRVRRDDVIGLTGSTGRSSGPHLHFEIRKDGKPVNPLTYVRQP